MSFLTGTSRSFTVIIRRHEQEKSRHRVPPWTRSLPSRDARLSGRPEDPRRGGLSEAARRNRRTGFAFSPHVWKDPADGSWKIVDAHQRKKVLGRLEAEGYEIPKFHTIEVLADDYATAKRRVLQGTSQYGRMTERGLFEFSKKAGISFEGLGGFRFPDIKLKALAAQFSPPVPPDGAKELGGELFVGLNCRCPKCGFEFEAKK